MIWLDIGAFCGFRRKMEVAESNLQPLVTVRAPSASNYLKLTFQALRRTGKFDRAAYTAIVPSADDGDDETERKWHEWVKDESYKRYVEPVEFRII